MEPDAEKMFVKDMQHFNIFSLLRLLTFYTGTLFFIILILGLGFGRIQFQVMIALFFMGFSFYVIAFWTRAKEVKAGKSVMKFIQSHDTPLNIIELANKMGVNPDLVKSLLSSLIRKTNKEIPWKKL